MAEQSERGWGGRSGLAWWAPWLIAAAVAPVVVIVSDTPDVALVIALLWLFAGIGVAIHAAVRRARF
ncbi:hypothetical protein BH20ACT2_BH20ACT2_08130 [soil metagenome]